ncbi:TMEM175 family protein [Candidatus Margulisiibacteriota bacterium]
MTTASGEGMTTKRIEALTDGIFAIAMTLLVLTLDLDGIVRGISTSKLHEFLLSQSDKFYNYALSFILLAVFWIIHQQQFHHIKKVDWKLLWMNIFMLMFVALIPFSTSLVGEAGNDWMAEVFFDLNMFAVGLFAHLGWWYSTRKHRLVDPELSQTHITMTTRRSMIVPLIALAAALTALVSPGLSSWVYILIPLVMRFPYFQRQ